ncbi:MAG TPA: M48 family metallopeptidase [Candidatus Sulfotelmatobacter sp.]|nr:M48 family metallopeptidase [Candidatus Sulfotelmatobacter sp.]
MLRVLRFIVAIALLYPALGIAQTPATPSEQPASTAASASAFDVRAAVDAYLAKMPAERRAKSDAYFEGGYWLILWDLVVTLVVMWLLLHFRWSARMRNLAERITRFRPLQTVLYWIQFFIVTSVLSFPMTVYEGFFRERKYDLMNQTFGGWMRDQVVGWAVGLVLGAILMVPLFGIVRRLGRTWWVWGAALMIVFAAFVSLIGPVYIAPLFNQYKTLHDTRIKYSILSMARANGIPARDVYEFDASKQSNRVSANVSGFAGTMRISLNDNLLNRCTLPEIETSMGHEMGHYVLNHSYKGLVMFGVVIVVAFGFLNWAIDYALTRWGAAWDIRGIGDVAVLPLAVIVFSLFFFLATPINNTITRTMEFEADMYGLNAARQPDAEANVDMLLGEYRKLNPGTVEEFLFYDHPSGRTRITAAMQWKAEHPETASVEEVNRPLFTGSGGAPNK